MIKKFWSQTGNGSLYLVNEPENKIRELKNGVYEVYVDIIGFKLRPVLEKFDFDYKIYGLETSLIERTLRYYHNTNTGNLGVLLNGIKGTGKTVTAKIIANKLEKPVILVTQHFDGAEDFINSIPQDIVVFIDEYEKIYQKSHDLLTIMDGALNSLFRRVFLMTTNSLYIDSNLLDRPSRVRYLQTFSNLSPDVVEEIVDDILIHTEHKTDTIKYISTLEIITVDIVKAVVNEVNIHNESPNEFKTVFNVTIKTGKYKVALINETGEKRTLAKGIKVNLRLPLGQNAIKNSFYIDDDYIGRITDVIDYSTIVVQLREVNNSELEDDETPQENPYELPDKGKVTLNITQDYVYNDSYMYNGKFEGVREGGYNDF